MSVPRDRVYLSHIHDAIIRIESYLGLTIGAAGIYIGDADDAPGAALMGILLMIGAVALGVRTARRKT